MKKIVRLPNAVKSACVYLFADVFSNGLIAITIPIFTRLMTTEQIGIVNIYTSWFALISSFSTLSLTSGGFSLAMKEFNFDRDAYVSSILFLTTIIASLIGFVINFEPFEKIFGLQQPLIILMCIGLLVTPARSFWLAKNRYEYNYKLSAVVTVASSMAASVLSIIAVLWATKYNLDDTGYYRVVVNYSVIYSIDAVIYIFLLKKGKRFIDKKYWHYSLGLSLPLVGYAISTQILSVSDRMMIDSLIGKSEVGIYGTLYAIGSVPIMIWLALNASFVPFLFENIEKRKEKIKKVTSILITTYAGMTVIITYFLPEVVNLLTTDEYVQAMFVMPPIVAGVFMISISNIYSNILVYYKKTSYIMYASIVAAIVNIVLNYYFIKEFGFVAAAYTTLFSYALLAFLEFWCAEGYVKKYGSDRSIYDNRKILFISIWMIILCFASLLLYKFTFMRYIIVVVLSIALLWNTLNNKELLLYK